MGILKNMNGNIPGGNFLGGNFPMGDSPGGSLIGGNYPGVFSGVGVFMIPAKQCVTPSASTDLPRKLYNFSREM